MRSLFSCFLTLFKPHKTFLEESSYIDICSLYSNTKACKVLNKGGPEAGCDNKDTASGQESGQDLTNWRCFIQRMLSVMVMIVWVTQW